ncbi:putative integral membrane protein [Acanthocheilonema viteae]
MHSLSDGSLYPWITTTMVNMLRDKDGKYENIKNVQQAKWFSRSTTYAIVTLHALGIFSATTHTKTGLIRYYGRWPVLLIGSYLCTFSIALFGFSFLDAYSTKKLAEKSKYIGLFFLEF